MANRKVTVVIKGEQGSGKTTLMNFIAGALMDYGVKVVLYEGEEPAPFLEVEEIRSDYNQVDIKVEQA